MCDDPKAEIAGTFRDCHADLVAFFARQHPDADSAADPAAESMLQFLRKLSAGTRPGSMRAYLFGIARHVGMAARRQRARRPMVVDAATLTTGRVEPIAAASGHKCGTPPAWRNDRELLIQTRRPPGDGRDTWAIWQRGKPLRWLDDTWTDKERKSLPLVGD